MLRKSFGTFVLTLLVSAGAFAKSVDDFRTATPEELALKSVAFAPGAPAVILDWVQRNDDIEFTSSEYVRIKILSEEGKKYGDIDIPYVPKYWDMRHIDARMTKPDGTIIPFNGKVYEKLIVKTGGIRVVSKTFTFPDLQPGCIVEYRYDLVMRGKYLRDTRYTLEHELPVLREVLWLRPYEKEFSSFFTYQGLPEGRAPKRVGDHFEVNLENVPAFEKERFAPPEESLKSWVNFFYVEGRTVAADVFWSNEGQGWTKRIESFISNSGYVRDQANAAIAGATTSNAKLRKLYARAQEIRNLAYEETKTEAEEKKLKDNKSADDVLRNGYGYSAEINRTFIALARAAGFEASSVRIGERDERMFSKNLPIGEQLDGEVAAITVDGKQTWFDAGTPGAPFGIVAWQKSHVPGILVSKKSAATWVMTPEEPASAAKMIRNAKLRIEDETIKGTLTITWNGQEALLRRVKNHNDDDEAVKKSLEEVAKGWFGDGSVIKLVKTSGMKSADDPVVAEFEVEVPSLGSFAGSRALVPLSVFGASAKNPFAATKRKYPIFFPYAWSEEDNVTLDVPADYAIESLPADATYDVSVAAYKAHYDSSGGKTIRFTRNFEVRSLYFDAESYGPLRSFFSKVAAADQEQLVLKKRAKAAAK